MADDWQNDKTIIESNKYMLDNEIATDVTFLVSNNINWYQQVENHAKITDDDRENITPGSTHFAGNSSSSKEQQCDDNTAVRFSAHKYMLTSRSSVFFSMFYGLLAERGEVRIEDVDPDAFNQMLNYIYTCKVDLTKENISYVLYVARKYMLTGLEKLCQQFMMSIVTATNACYLIDQFFNSDEEVLVKNCTNLIMFQTAKALNSPTACLISRNTLETILGLKLYTEDEYFLFKFMFNWGKRECTQNDIEPTPENIRSALGNALWKISFISNNFRLQQLADYVIPTKILEAEEISSIFAYRCSVLNEENKTPPANMSDVDRYVESRYFKAGYTFSLSKWGNTCKSPQLSQLWVKIEFEVIIPLDLKRFILSPIANNLEMHIPRVSIDGRGVQSRIKNTSPKEVELIFPRRIELRPGKYEMEFEIEIRSETGLLFPTHLKFSKEYSTSGSVYSNSLEFFHLRPHQLNL